MKNKNSQNKDFQIVQLIISFMMIICLIIAIHFFANTTLIMLDPKLETVLVRINALFDYKSLIRMLLGTLYIVIVSATFFTVGMIGDWFVNVINNPENHFVQIYFDVTKFINRWYLIMAISLWLLVSLSDVAFNYFTILISLIALLHELRSKSKLLQFDIITHRFLKDRNYLEEK
ncbi:hypothetical protein [Streptococcus pluranimalium]|uniref:Uncharacterized protein n=1 Tax=Streptococcus pluranimalium TaxID=82348 RepID=A0A345VJB1_9STRE|nr:hypothetical protein [Streptococcus pluranimalium]AXJ12813.1 hypothetical protein Sp14A_08920 [Streptococcus pluranimalium]